MNQELLSNYAVPLEMSDNTAAGMGLYQEDSMYLTPAASPSMERSEEKDNHNDEGNEIKVDEDVVKDACQTMDTGNLLSCQTYPNSSDSSFPKTHGHIPSIVNAAANAQLEPVQVQSIAAIATSSDSMPTPTATNTGQRPDSIPRGLAKVDLELDRTANTQPWDISDKRPVSKSPSSLFQPYARYIGTQQSDRQTYNVEVTILTVDMDQCSLSGYLLIRGLTPEHPMLQTFFTGQIVGGPNQKYSFKTMEPTWGASDKVDLQHWLRFPAWRHLSSHAKRDMSFDFPLDNQPWHMQDHVFMRWKEHFLVPDHKQSNIQGASFEGFYYICLNQTEGKISGVYFHSKSEK